MKKQTLVLAAAAAFGLAGCEAIKTRDSSRLEWDKQIAYYDRGIQGNPFSSGRSVTVLAEHHGDMASYVLTPCGGAHICGARTGTLVRTPKYDVVRGAYPGVTFWLSPGGDGVIDQHGTAGHLAWDWQKK